MPAEREIRIYGERVLLRQPRSDDLDLYFRLVADEQIAYFSDDRMFIPVERKYFKTIYTGYILKPQVAYYPMVIVDRVTELAVGQIHAGKIDRDNLNCYVGFQILPEYQNQGFGQDALFSFLHHLFNDFNYHRIAAEVYDYNRASISLLKSAGFRVEGRMRDGVFRPDGYHDKILYGLLKKEWNASEIVIGMEEVTRILLVFRMQNVPRYAEENGDSRTIEALQDFYAASGDVIEKWGGQLIWYREEWGLAVFAPDRIDTMDELADELNTQTVGAVYEEARIVLGPAGYSGAEHLSVYSPRVADLMKKLD